MKSLLSFSQVHSSIGRGIFVESAAWQALPVDVFSNCIAPFYADGFSNFCFSVIRVSSVHAGYMKDFRAKCVPTHNLRLQPEKLGPCVVDPERSKLFACSECLADHKVLPFLIDSDQPGQRLLSDMRNEVIPCPPSPTATTLHDSRLYVLSTSKQKVAVVDLAQNDVIKDTPLPSQCLGIAVLDNANMYLPTATNEVIVLGPDGRLLSRLGVTDSLRHPHGICLSEEKDRLYVIDGDHTVLVVTLDGTLLSKFIMPRGHFGGDSMLAIGEQILVAGYSLDSTPFSSSVLRFDTNGTYLGEFCECFEIRQYYVAYFDGFVFVTDGRNKVSCFT